MTTATTASRRGQLIDLIAVERALAGDYQGLTDPEVRVAVHAAEALGWSMVETARRLHVSEKKVKEHRATPPPVQVRFTGRRVA